MPVTQSDKMTLQEMALPLGKLHRQRWQMMRKLFGNAVPRGMRGPCQYFMGDNPIEGSPALAQPPDPFVNRIIIIYSKKPVQACMGHKKDATRSYPIIGFDPNSSEKGDLTEVSTREWLGYLSSHEIGHTFHFAVLCGQLKPIELRFATAPMPYITKRYPRYAAIQDMRERMKAIGLRKSQIMTRVLSLYMGKEYSYCREGIAEFASFLCALKHGEHDVVSVIIARRLAIAHFVDNNPLAINEYRLPFGMDTLITREDRQKIDGIFGQYLARLEYARSRSAMGIEGIARSHSAGVLRVIQITTIDPTISLIDLCLSPFHNDETPQQYVDRIRTKQRQRS